MSDPLTPPPGLPDFDLTPPPAGPSSGLTPPPSSNLKTFTFRMTLPENWARVDHATLADAAAVDAQLQRYVELGKLTGPQVAAMAPVFAGLAPMLQGLQIPLVAAYAEPADDGRFGLASLFAGPHSGGFPLNDSADDITVNDAPGKLQRGTLNQPFGADAEITVYSAQYVLEAPVSPGQLVITATTPVVEGFDPAAADARFHEAVREVVFHPAS